MPDDKLPFVAALRSDVTLPDVERAGGLAAHQIIASREWFDRRRRELASTGGRPSNPDWTLRRQIPFSAQTWEQLSTLAVAFSDLGARIGPGQLAAFLIEEAVVAARDQPAVQIRTVPRACEVRRRHREPTATNLRGWRMPTLFSGIPD
jgi:hypothetical protein